MNNQFDLFLQRLIGLGLSSNESTVYATLLEKSPMTGYEVAKRCNLYRGSIYTILEKLVEKGAVQKTIDEKYLAADLNQFLKMRLSFFSDCADYLKNNVKSLNFVETYESVFFVYGQDNIVRRVKEMIISAKRELSLVAFKEELELLRDLLVQAHKRHVKLHIMTFGNFSLEGIDIVYHSREKWVLKKLKGRFLTVVKDLEEGLMGALDNTERCFASWSKNYNYCTTIHLYIAHEIALIRIFNLLDKPTISKIRSELKDKYTRTILEGMPTFKQRNSRLLRAK